MNKQVRYGDQIYIEISNIEPPPKTNTRLLCSNSFIEQNVFAVKASHFCRTNFRNCVFVVLPSLVDSQDELDTLQSLDSKLLFLSHNSTNTIGEKYLKKEIEQKKELIQLNKETLNSLNDKIMSEMENRTVKYGEVVLLQHLESGFYLCADSSYLPYNPTFYNLRLQKERTSSCYFKLFSHTVEEDRSPIDYENEMKLVSAQYKTIVTMGQITTIDELNLTEDDDEKHNLEKPTFPADAIRRESPIHSFNTDLEVVGTTLETGDNNKIKLIAYCSKEEFTDFTNRKLIKNGDYVRFQLDDAYLTFSQTIHRRDFGLISHNIEEYKYNYLNSIFQLVKMEVEEPYPRGLQIISYPKLIENETDSQKFYIRHLATGQYLSTPSENPYTHPPGDYDMLERPPDIPFFYLVNSYLKNQEIPLANNSRVYLKAFKNRETEGKFYSKSEIEKQPILQYDANSGFFVGFKNSEDKIRSKIKLVKKTLKENSGEGSYFKVSTVTEEEMRKVLMFESYSNSLKRFMRVLQCVLREDRKVTPVILQNELQKILTYSSDLIQLLNNSDKQAQILSREFKMIDYTSKFLYYFLVDPNIKNALDNKKRKFDMMQLVEFLQNLTTITLNSTADNELTHIHVSQFIRTFINAIFKPSPLIGACEKLQAISLKDCIISLLKRFLSDNDLDTLGQLNFYEDSFFENLDKHSDYSVHLLKLMDHYCKSKAPNLVNTLRTNFIQKYVSDDVRISRVFPKITFIQGEDDFELMFSRPDGTIEKSMLSTITDEVQNYVIWVFKLINNIAESKSLKFLDKIMTYYPEKTCEALVTSRKVPPKVKNEVLITLKNVHFSYAKLPFDAIPPKIQIALSSSKLEQTVKSYQELLMLAEQNVVGTLERNITFKNRPASSTAKGISVKSLTSDILKSESEQLVKGNLSSLNFTLQIMMNILQDENLLNHENLYLIHHSLCHIIAHASKELCKQKPGPYCQPFIENQEKIFEVIKQVDEHVVRLAFKEAINSIKEKVLKTNAKVSKLGNLNIVGQPLSQTYRSLENEIVQSVIDSMSEEWKSKQKVYKLAKNALGGKIYDEKKLMKSLWKIVKAGDQATTTRTVNLIKNKTNFETKFTKELVECSLIDEESEVLSFVGLASSLLNLNKITRSIKVKLEFNSSEKEDNNTIDEIVENLEKILLIFYDYQLHMSQEHKDIPAETAKEIFLKRLRYCKMEANLEIPFEFKPRCVKKFYQKVMRMLQSHQILIPLIKYLTYPPPPDDEGPGKSALSDDIDRKKAKYGLILVMIIICLFLHKNASNQQLLSLFPDFITIYYCQEYEETSVESPLMYYEMLRDNKKLLKLSEDYLFVVATYTFVEKLNYFKIDSECEKPVAINLLRSLPFLFESDMPKNMFDPADFMTRQFIEFNNFLTRDNRISLPELLNKNKTAKLDHIKSLVFIDECPDHILLEMPLFYSIIREFLQAQVTFALTESRERVLVLHTSLALEKITPFLFNENIEFSFELKKLTLQTVENLFFKNIFKNTNIFYTYDHFVSFSTTLLIDAYAYLKTHSKNPNSLNIFKTGFFKSEKAESYIAKYDNLLSTNLDDITFLQYQSLVIYRDVWKEYIYYLLCDFFGNLIIHVKEFMVMNKEKDRNRQNMFEIWLEIVLKIQETESNQAYHTRIDDTLKKCLVHSDYAAYSNMIYEFLGRHHKSETSVIKKGPSIQSELNLEKVLNRYFGEKSSYKQKYSDLNVTQVSRSMGLDRKILIKLINVLLTPETALKDTIFILKILRKLVENQNQTEINKGQPMYLWEDVSRAELKKIAHIQDTLGELKIVEAVFFLLYKYQQNKDALKEILLLCIALLFGGNSKMQEMFYEEFKKDYDNQITQNLTHILEKTLESFSEKQKENISKAYENALQFIFSSLINSKEDSYKIINGQIEVPSELKEYIALDFEENGVKNELLTISEEDYKLLCITLKFFQNLCEGHYLNFQEFLRDQTVEGHSKSFNIPEFLRQAYHEYHKHLNAENAEIGIKILDLLIEIEQGDSKLNNQLLLQKTFLNDVCITLNGFNNDLDLLSRGFGFDTNHPQFIELKSKGLVLLKDIVERAEPEDRKKVVQYINLRSLVCVFKENVVAFHKKKKGFPSIDKLVAEDIWDPNLSNAFLVYFMLKHLSFDNNDAFSPEIQDNFDRVFLDGKDLDTSTAYKYLTRFFPRYTGSIEILQKDTNKIMKIYYPISVAFDYLKSHTKEDFESKVDRSNTQTKIADLIDASEELIKNMNVNYKSRNRLFGLNLYIVYNLIRMATDIIAFTVGMFNLFHLVHIQTVKIPGEGEGAEDVEITVDTVDYDHDQDYEVQLALNITQTVLGFILFVAWFQTRLTGYLTFKWNEYVNTNVKDEGPLPADIIQKLDNKDLITNDIGMAVLRLKGPYSEEWEYVQNKMKFRFYLYNIYFVAQSLDFLWHLAYFLICVFSGIHPLVASFQMCDIVVRSDTVGRITTAVSRNATQFFWTLVLLFVTIYIYSFIGLYFLHWRYIIDDGQNDTCQDAYSCFLTSLNAGLRSGGGIADYIKGVKYVGDNKSEYFWGVVFDLSFFIIMIILFLNLIFGMIIDAFGELRDEKSSNEDDKLNVCFICGLERGEYERIGNFDKHLHSEHDKWQYLGYIIYLLEKEKAFSTSLTDVESYVIKLYKRADCAWIPVGRSLSLERISAKGKKEEKSEVLELKEDLTQVMNRIAQQNTILANDVKELRSEIHKTHVTNHKH